MNTLRARRTTRIKADVTITESLAGDFALPQGISEGNSPMSRGRRRSVPYSATPGANAVANNMGAAPAAPPRDAQQAVDTLRQFLPLAKDLLDDSAVEDVEVLKAKIRNHRRMMRNMPEPLLTAYRNKVGVLEARLRAAEDAKRLEREEQQSTRTWRVLGYTVTTTGVVVGTAAAVALLTVARSYKGGK